MSPESPPGHLPRPSTPPVGRRCTVWIGLLAGCGGEEKGPQLELTAALPDEVPEGTVLRVGDPATQVALEPSGLDEELDIEVEWANISGGPKTLEAFRADAIDVGGGGRHPAAVRAVDRHRRQDRRRPRDGRPARAPDLRARRRARRRRQDARRTSRARRSPTAPARPRARSCSGCCSEAGLTQDDVELVEMASVDDAYVNALGSKQVDVAPLGQTLVKTYLAKYEQDGATTIAPGRARRRLDALRAHRRCSRTPTRRPRSRSTSRRGPRPSSGSPSTPTSSPRPTTSSTRASPTEDAKYVVEALGAVHGPDQTGTTSSRATRRPSTCSRRSRTRSPRRGRPLRPPLREGHRRAVEACSMTDDPDHPPARRPPPVEDAGPVRRRLGPGDADPRSACCSARRCCWRRGSSARPPGCSTSAP